MEDVPMHENRRDDRSQNAGREASSNERDDQQSDDLARRREAQRVDHLTRREREERWPIG
jgi:hypothetical protein